MPSKTVEKRPKSKPHPPSSTVPPLPPGEGRTKSGVRRTGWPGPKSTALFEEEQRFIAPGIQTIALNSKLTIEKGEGSRLTDVDGNTYLDFNVGVSVASLGYSHPKYIAALKAQIDKVTVGSFTSKVRLELVKL